MLSTVLIHVRRGNRKKQVLKNTVRLPPTLVPYAAEHDWSSDNVGYLVWVRPFSASPCPSSWLSMCHPSRWTPEMFATKGTFSGLAFFSLTKSSNFQSEAPHAESCRHYHACPYALSQLPSSLVLDLSLTRLP